MFRLFDKVINGEFALSLSTWSHVVERNPLMDFLPLMSDRRILALTPQPAEVDAALYFRPFVRDAWLFLGATSAFLLVCLEVPSRLFPHFFESTSSFRIVHITSMGFLILMNAYYGGAMTMFFTNDVSIPFENIRDVMRDSSWDLIVKEGRCSSS